MQRTIMKKSMENNKMRFLTWMRDVVKSEYYTDTEEMDLALERLSIININQTQ